ncbi:Gfo/Idh/MocA family oxidoreductase [Kibdelosporangium philippinense]|uniref:Gfo/Idh/MocA family oxidoreductase n=1 Tax=Kibdelosporangium philippinense TaxID=211113 RepID=A0ABS8ZWR9_9PSEU|nr:Gfo/Idh/MocA family oxidoreductase [Kibdelosporangium philippinense]MCE7011485.1 Gfo/Idh/MocA family oxidoreductase [Kibdelosporangium philippinense]
MSNAGDGTIGVGMVGHAFMGRVHSHAWRTVHHFFDVPQAPRLVALGGRDLERTKAAAAKLGWDSVETDWRALIARDDVQIVDICTPGDSHKEIALAALAAGKHVLCEKPLANSVEEAEEMAEAAAAASANGQRSMVAFNYRRVPALAVARQMVAEGRLGKIRHVRAQYLQDWLSDPNTPMAWRLRKEEAGSGALGDIGAHIIDASQFVLGEQLTGVSALTETFVHKRPIAGDPDGRLDDVTVDDTALFIGKFGSGAMASYEATRFALGRKNSMRLEVNGEKGSLAFDFESMNELSYFDGEDADETAGFRRVLITEGTHPYVGAWWPPGHIIGYEHTFTHEVFDFLTAIGNGTDPAPSFADGLQVQKVLGAVEASAGNDSRWTSVS